MSDHSPSRRLFFALWPDESVRAAMAELARVRLGGVGRAVPAQNLHVTLAFLGSVGPQTQACLEAAAGTIQGQPFRILLDRLGFFPRPRVVWLGSDELPPALAQLVTRLGEGLRECGLEPEGRPFQAHVTVARKVKRFPQSGPVDPVEWWVRDFCLVESHTRPQGAVYEVLRRWPLAGNGGQAA